MSDPIAPGDRSARARLGAELRRIRVAAGLSQRAMHGLRGSGHASNVEQGRTPPSWDFIERYLAHGGDRQQLRSLYDRSRFDSEDHKTDKRRETQPGSFSSPPAPQDLNGLTHDDIRRHYVVEARAERYLFNAAGVISRLHCVSTVRALSPGTALFYSVHSYDADQRPGVLDVEAADGCTVEHLDRQPTGAIRAYFRIDHPLNTGDVTTLAYLVQVNSSIRTRPILLCHPGPGTETYALDARFSTPSLPVMMWWFDTDNELSALIPADGHEFVLDAGGRYRKTFDSLVPSRCYGFSWKW